MVQESCHSVTALPDAPSSLAPTPVEDLQNLREYFRRPRQVFTGNIPATSTQIVNVSVTPNWTFGTAITNGLIRLSGVFSARFTAVYTLQVNATPFHNNLLVLSAQYGNQSGNAYSRGRPATCTNLHHVRLDLAEDTSVQLRVPFLADAEITPVTSNRALHQLNLCTPAACPLPAGLSAPVYNIYLHIEDLELFGAAPLSSTTITVQSGRKMSPITKEFEDEAYPLSSGVHLASRSLRYIARGIPMLSSLAGMPAWLLERTAGAIRSYGYAKPIEQGPPVRMNAIDSALESNVDVASAAQVVGPFLGNRITIDKTLGRSDVDEMALSYLFSRWSQTCIFNLKTADATNKVVYAASVTPSAYWYRYPADSATNAVGNIGPPNVATATTNSFQPTTLFAVSSIFKLWTGTIRYRFTFVKTKMHAGRVLVSYAPSELNTLSRESRTTLPVTFAGGPEVSGSKLQPFGLSAIFDLRDNNVFTFDVPYFATTPWAGWAESTGTLTLSILDPIIASSVVSSTVPVIVEVCGGDDFKTAVPFPGRFAPNETGTILFQSGVKLKAYSDSTDQYTIGHEITSAKQIIMMPFTTIQNTIQANSSKLLQLNPWFVRPERYAIVPSVPTCPIPITPHAIISSLFAFVTGSTEYHVYTCNIANLYIQAYHTTQGISTPNPNAAGYPASNTGSIVTSSGWAPAHFNVPLFLPTPRLDITALDRSTVQPAANSMTDYWSPVTSNPVTLPVTRGLIRVSNLQSGQSQVYVLSYNAGDDSRCALFQGPPPFFLPSSNATTDVYNTSDGWWNELAAI